MDSGRRGPALACVHVPLVGAAAALGDGAAAAAGAQARCAAAAGAWARWVFIPHWAYDSLI